MAGAVFDAALQGECEEEGRQGAVTADAPASAVISTLSLSLAYRRSAARAQLYPVQCRHSNEHSLWQPQPLLKQYLYCH